MRWSSRVKVSRSIVGKIGWHPAKTKLTRTRHERGRLSTLVLIRRKRLETAEVRQLQEIQDRINLLIDQVSKEQYHLNLITYRYPQFVFGF